MYLSSGYPASVKGGTVIAADVGDRVNADLRGVRLEAHSAPRHLLDALLPDLRLLPRPHGSLRSRSRFTRSAGRIGRKSRDDTGTARKAD